MNRNKIGIYYIHWEQHDLLWRSIAAQVDLVDYIFVLDSSLEKQEIKVPEHCRHKVEIEHTHRFGSGFENQYNLGYFEQVDARNYAMSKVFEKCDFMFQCDADEFHSPGAFEWAATAKNSILNTVEVVWRTPTSYTISPHRHNRGANKSTGIKHVPNPDKAFLAKGNFHKSRHGIYRWPSGSVVKVDNLWHNHLHYLYSQYNSKNFNVVEVSPGDPNVLFDGVFPFVYDEFIELRKKDCKYGERK